MEKSLFKEKYGVIVACDVDTIDKLKEIIENTHSVEGIVGYKVGCQLGLKYGLPQVSNIVKDLTNLPVIYDHQKAGTDIPQIGENFAKVCAESEIDGVIIFPQSGPATEEGFIKALIKRELIPLVGGEMTHPKYLMKDGGFIRDDAPIEMYKIGVENGINHFIVPGNKPEIIRKYHKILSSIAKNPKYCIPGIGRQGGEITSAFKYLGGASAYAIIGSAIYKQENMKDAAKMYCREVLKFI